jgi:hypothetical protein
MTVLAKSVSTVDTCQVCDKVLKITMKKIIYGLVAIAVLILAVLIGHQHRKPRAIQLIQLSDWAQAQDIGAAIYDRLRTELGPERVVIMGGLTDNANHNFIAQQFLTRAAQDGHPFQQIIIPPSTLKPPTNAQTVVLDIHNDMERVVNIIHELPQQQKLFIYTKNSDTSHLVEGNAIHRLETGYKGQTLFSISLAKLFINQSEINQIKPTCHMWRKTRGTNTLECAAAERSRPLFGTTFALNKYWLVMSQEAHQDYLALIRAP